MTLRIGVIMYQTSLTKGQELVAQNMVREFRKQGYEAFLITSIFHDWEPVMNIEDVRSRAGYIHMFDETIGIPVLRVNSENTTWPPRRIAFMDFMGVLERIVQDLKLNVLITHSTLWNGPEEVLKFVQWRRKLVTQGSPLSPIIFGHMSHFQEPSDERYAVYERSYREAWNDVSLAQIVSEADLILVTTPYEQEWMAKQSQGAKDSKFMLFPGGVDGDLDAVGDPREFRSNYRIPRKTRLISYLGTVEERKNVLSLVEVAKLLSVRQDIHFAIAGKIEDEYGQKVREEAAKTKNVTILGPITEQEKAIFIRTSYVNITMSRAEALGLSQLEFMSGGIPVITSGVGGQSWIVKDGVNGIVLKGPDDVKGAVSAVLKLTTHSSFRNRLAKNAASVAFEFSIQRLVYNLAKRLEKMVGGVSNQEIEEPPITAKEQVLDAWVSRQQRVVATTHSLVIDWLGTGKKAIVIPYNEITKIVSHAQSSRLSRALWIGFGATLLWLLARFADVPAVVAFDQSLARSAAAYLPSSAAAFLVAVTPFIPLFISSVVYPLTRKKGYLVFFGASKKLFLPKEFLKALKFADKSIPERTVLKEEEKK
jgi:glycosyltransferase involved in cell wall biosynthesis